MVLRVTAEELAVIAIRERGYLVAGSEAPMTLGRRDNLWTAPWASAGPLNHPVFVFQETDAADYLEQRALFGLPQIIRPGMRFFYRASTD